MTSQCAAAAGENSVDQSDSFDKQTEEAKYAMGISQRHNQARSATGKVDWMSSDRLTLSAAYPAEHVRL